MAVPSLGVPRGLALVCGCTAAWAFNFGMATQLTTLWLNNLWSHAPEHVNTIIGLNQGFYYLGLAAVVMLVPRMIRRHGLLCSVGGLVLSGLSTILFPYAHSLVGWYALRLLGGAASAMTLIPFETFISLDAQPEHRSRNFGWYAVALTLGGGLGIALAPSLFQAGVAWPFWLQGATVGLAALAFFAYRPTLPVPAEETSTRPSVFSSRSILSYGTAWSQGFLEGGMLVFLILYLTSLGLSAESAGVMVGASMVGILLFQVPVSWLGDRLGRVPVLLVCYAVVVICLAALPWCGPGMWLAIWLFLLGGCSGSFYPLGMALLGNRDSEMGVARAYAWYMILESIGSQMGPPLMGVARDAWGEGAMFAVGEAAVVSVLVCWVAVHCSSGKRMAERPEAAMVPPGRDAA